MPLIPAAAGVKIGQDVEVIKQKDQPSKTYRIDFSAKRVNGYVDESEAMKQAIIKILQSERFLYLIYSWNYGIEMNAVVGKSYPVINSEIKRILREALLEDRRISDVYDISTVQINRRTIVIKFKAATIFGEITIESEVNTSV